MHKRGKERRSAEERASWRQKENRKKKESSNTHEEDTTGCLGLSNSPSDDKTVKHEQLVCCTAELLYNKLSNHRLVTTLDKQL